MVALGACLTAGALCFASSAQAASLNVSSASGAPGSKVTFTVTLSAAGAMVAGTQNDITFDPANIPVEAKTNGHPNCTVNPDINKGATSFAFRPNGCTGTACTSMRGLVLATDNVDPIPDGSVLYTCTVDIAATASGQFPLTISGVILSDPAGMQIPGATGTNGSVTAGSGGPTLTPAEATPTPTTAAVACVAPAIQLPMVQGQAGVQGSINATLLAGATPVAGTQNDITFAAPLAIAAKANGHPDCTVNGNINKGATSFAFRPNGCTGTACTSIRALVLATDNVDPIPGGSVLYTCNVNIDVAATAGTYPLPVVGVILSDPAGNQIAGATGCNGGVTIGGGPTPTSTQSGPTNTPTPTATHTPPPVAATSTPTRTAAVTATATPPPVPALAQSINATDTTITLAGDLSGFPPSGTIQIDSEQMTYLSLSGNTLSGVKRGANGTTAAEHPAGSPVTVIHAAPFNDDEGGCNISATGSSSSGWLVLIPAIGLLVLRRRSG